MHSVIINWLVIFYVFFWTGQLVWEHIGPKVITRFYKIKRRIKIWRGIIKVSPNDPYGEEIDDDDEVQYEKNRY